MAARDNSLRDHSSPRGGCAIISAIVGRPRLRRGCSAVEAGGPETFEGLVALFSQRPKWRQILVWCDGFESWQRADEVPEILSRIVIPPPLSQKAEASRIATPPPLPHTTGSSSSPEISSLPSVASQANNQLGALSKRFKGLVEDSALVRSGLIIGAVVVAALVLTWTVLLTPLGRTAVLLKIAGLIGYFTPALVIGAIWGFIRYDRRACGLRRVWERAPRWQR